MCLLGCIVFYGHMLVLLQDEYIYGLGTLVVCVYVDAHPDSILRSAYCDIVQC